MQTDDNQTEIEDEFADLDTADRGDELTDEQKADPPRNADGTFAPKSDEAGEPDEPDEADETGEAEEAEEQGEPGDEEGDEEAEEGGDNQNLPIRLNKAREQRDRERAARETAERELEAARLRLAELERGGQQPQRREDPLAKLEEEADELYEKIEDARADGDTKTAAQLQRQLDRANREIGRVEAERVATQTTSQSAEAARFDALLDVLEAAVPEANPKHEDFDRDQIKELELLVVGYEHAGINSTLALKKATKLLFGYDFDNPAKEAEAAPEEKKPATRKPDVKKAVDTQKKQPPDASSRGVDKDSTKIRVTELDDEAFDALPESKKAELRGDFG